MLNTLIESKKRKELNRAEVVLSVLAHVLLIGLAVFVTTRIEHFDIVDDRPVLITYVEPTPVVEPVTQVQRPITRPVSTPNPRPSAQPAIQTPTEIPSTIPATDPTAPVTQEPTGESPGPVSVVTGSPIGRDSNAPYFADQVSKQASLRGQLRLTYPAALESNRISGRVVLQFVIETNGRVRAETIQVIESSHSLFTAAAEAAILNARFTPARIGANTVRQLVQLPITFRAQ